MAAGLSYPLAKLRWAAQDERDKRARMAAMKEEAERDLLAFVRMCWPIIEPGKPFVEGWIIDFIVDVLMATTAGQLTKVCLNVPPGSMKPLSSDTPVFTTWGWKTHGELQPGDFVFGMDGLPKRVLAVTEETEEDAWEVSFDDRSSLVAGAGHLWAIERDNLGETGKWRRDRIPMIVPTTELLASGRATGGLGPDRIPVAAPLSLPPRRLIVDPYVLGAWLGDGTSQSGMLNVGEEDIAHFKGLGEISRMFEADGDRRKQNFYRVRIPELQTKLRVMGLLNNKHIPDDYLEASTEQRVALLQGLMDTDGCATTEGACFFSNKNPVLADQVHRLVCSLGIKTFIKSRYSYTNGKQYGPHFNISFTRPGGLDVFRLARKLELATPTKNARTLSRYVREVRPVGRRTVKCISVEGSIYLAGHAFIPTHNSSLLNVLWPAWEWGPQGRPSLRYLSISYSDKVPTRDNLRFAQILKHPVYRQCWGDLFRLTQDGAEAVGNDQTGWKRVSGTGGSVTGFRGDRLCLDDLNNPEDVESETVRHRTERFVREIMPSRVNDLATSAIINLQQRTHQMDATGVLLEYLRDQYTFVCVPAEFDPLRIFPVVLRRDEDGEPEETWVDPRSLDEDGKQLRGLSTNQRGEPVIVPGSPMAQAAGETFWPERFPPDELATLRAGMTPYSWDSQFNQTPGVRGGAIIRQDWWKNWPGEYPALGTVIASLDTAIEEGEQNDYNALTVWGAFAGDQGQPLLLLIAAWRMRATLAELVTRVADTCRERKVDYLLVEHKTRGRDVHDEVLRLNQARSWQTQLVPPAGDKVSRLKAVSRMFSGDYRRLPDGGTDEHGRATYQEVWAGGMIHAPDRDFADEVIAEVASFPYGKHDDYVDSTSMALLWVRQNGVVLHKDEFEEQEMARNKFRRDPGVPYAIRRSR